MRLLTWNVHRCRGIDGEVDPARVARETRRLADPDVICFQEVEVGDQLESLPLEFPGYQAFSVCPPDSGPKGFGNLLLTRLPVKHVLRHSLPGPPAAPPGAWGPSRAAVEAVIEVPCGALRVLTTHLEHSSAELRAAQVDRLRAIHADALRQSAILCGDFNFRAEDPLHGRLRDAGLEDAWQAQNPGVPHPPTFRVHERTGEDPYCCDFVFVSADLVPRLTSIRIDGPNQASDHQPVIVDLG